MTLRALLALLLVSGTLAACSGGAATRSGDARYGDRKDAWAPDGRETLLITPPADSTAYFVYTAVVDSVSVRTAGRAAPGESVGVEVLVKGALPDACSALNAVTQSRTGHFVTLALTMRQPRGDVCAQVVRPFRFYVALDEPFEAGSYTLSLNGRVTPFQVLPAAP